LGNNKTGTSESRRRTRHLRQVLSEAKTAINSYRLVIAYCHTYKRRLAALSFLSLVTTVPPLVSPKLTELLIDKAYPARNFALFGWVCAAMMGMILLSRVLSVVSKYQATYVRAFIEYKLTFRVFNAIHHLPQTYREQCGPGMFLVRAGRDVSAVAQSVTERLPDIVTTAFTFLIAIPMMMKISLGIATIVLAVIPINYLITAYLTGKTVRLSMAAFTIAEKLATFTQETITGATLCRIFALDRVRRTRLAQLLRKRLHTTFDLWRTKTQWGELAGLINALWGTLVLCGGWYLVFTDRLQLGQAVALSMYINVLRRPFEQLALLYQSLISDSVAARRLLEILDASQAPTQRTRQKVLKVPPQRYELSNVSFGYTEQRLCLRDVDLNLQAGQTIAVIGPTGGGKSTLLRILCGLEDRYRGQFMVDGYDLQDIDQNSYLHHVSWVPQRTFFFSGSIRSNLPGNGSIAEADLRKYAVVLGLDTVIDAMPEGFDEKLGCGNNGLSQGQYQKLAVLRAVLKDASVLLLDEVTASLDIDSERKLLQGVLALRRPGCLTVLVTHHIPITLEPWIDEIVVLVDGRIAEKGSSRQLWEKDGFYRHWLDICRGATQDSGIPEPQLKDPLKNNFTF